MAEAEFKNLLADLSNELADHGDGLFIATPDIGRAMLDFLAGRRTPARLNVAFRLAPLDLSPLIGRAP